MTDSEYRIGKVEETVHNIDKRQETFETFMKTHIEKVDEQIRETKERMNRMDERMDRMDAKMDNISNQVHNLTVAATVGVAAIVIAILLK